MEGNKSSNKPSQVRRRLVEVTGKTNTANCVNPGLPKITGRVRQGDYEWLGFGNVPDNESGKIPETTWPTGWRRTTDLR
jgi:hypothetical protein